ncbi:MAG: TPR domain-containing protein [Candidatus Magnetoglobus multicellularis str. Araruama]|uniref:TPR domain-containing protein n=1 Tax=Candidatus Magnetoglobus multicellularis str. Araruama TaxID=890399 RepID=A0A1V1PEJ0_9BACT|nr:MAG: TPR domain-containing protein [Candidatus Magnetoglobus multicellularis str. Araruama]
MGTIFVCILLGSNHSIADDALFQKGVNLYQKGELKQSGLIFKELLEQMDIHDNVVKYVEVVTYLGNIYQDLGYHQRSIELIEPVLHDVEKTEHKVAHVRLLSQLGDLHFSLGQMGKVIDYFLKAVEEAKKTENSELIASVYNNVANALAVDKDYKTAGFLFEEALVQLEKSTDDDLRATILINLLRLEYAQKNYKTVVANLEGVILQIAAMKDSHQKVNNLISISLFIKSLRQQLNLQNDTTLQKSMFVALSNAQVIAQELSDHRNASYANGYMAQLYENEKRYAEALRLTRSAVFHAELCNAPEALYLWQWQLGRLFKAQGKVDQAQKAYNKSIQTLNPIRQELFIGYRTKQDFFNTNVKPVYLGLAELILDKAESVQDPVQKEKYLMEARNTMETLKTAELEDFFKDECVAAKSTNDNKLVRSPEHTAILYPITLKSKLAILVTLPNEMHYVAVPLDLSELSEKILTYRKKLQTRPNNRFLYDSMQIYDWVIRPVEDKLKENDVTTLVIAPDGVLRLIPFSTLYDSELFLIQKYAISTIPAISLTDASPMDKENCEILLGGLAEGRQGFSPLPSVPAELRDIKKIMSSKILIKDKVFTIPNITETFKNNEYSIVHIATHGVFGGAPETSFLLTYESKLNMNLLEQLIGLSKYRKQKVELLTLSACQTALGNERAAMGLAGVAVKAGVKGVIATLWFVDDECTSIAIREFYRQLRKPELTKAQAMQNVQKILIGQRRYWHPLYWAPFLVIGNWM